jgi:RNA polymerase sigma-70 factor (ECF subfamily)
MYDRRGFNERDDGVGAAEHGQPSSLDTSTALSRAQAGDEDAFATLYRAIQPGLLRYTRVLVGKDAEDVASEAWLHVARGLASFRGDVDGFRAWTTTIARNRAMDSLRRQHRRPVADIPVEELAPLPGRDDTEGSAVDALATDAALALIARLPPDQAEAVLLRVLMGLDAAAAGRVLGKRPGAVRTAAYRGLRALAHHLERRGTLGSSDGVTQPGPSTLNDMR